MTDRVGGDSDINSGKGSDKMKPNTCIYTQRKMRMVFRRTLTWQRILDGDANADEVYYINNNNV